tara:strand:- start:7990 stop:8607 length:618 start_codon:yes stop_codon:yes gene_type:complete
MSTSITFEENVDKAYIDAYNNCSWVKLYYGIVSKVINENNFKRCAEIGIGYGFHAKEILMSTNVDTLYLVDPYISYSNDGFPLDVMKFFGNFEKLAENVKNNLKPYDSRYTWFRQPSITINNDQLSENLLDLVFIDADHSYEAVKNDLSFWYKKIRIGGWLMGDDYNSCHPGTTKAVDEFANKNNLKINFLKKDGVDYPIYYFIK